MPRTRSSHTRAANLTASFVFRRGAGIIKLLVSLVFATFGIGTRPGRRPAWSDKFRPAKVGARRHATTPGVQDSGRGQAFVHHPAGILQSSIAANAAVVGNWGMSA